VGAGVEGEFAGGGGGGRQKGFSAVELIRRQIATWP